MGSVSSSKNKPDPKSGKPASHHRSSNKSSSSKKHSTVYRVPTCKYHEKCPSIKNVKHQHYTIYDLNHLTQYSHPRKHCQSGLKCKYFANVMKGSYSLPDLCHYSIYLHPISRFITSFPKTKTTKSDAPSPAKPNQNYSSSMMYNSLQMPRSGEKMGLTTYKKLGIMICDGACGSIITRGLWKCWNFKDLIWNYKYRKFKKGKDPNYTPVSITIARPPSTKYDADHDDDRKDIQQCMVTMIESVVALAGESFLVQMFNLMMKTQEYLRNNNNDNNDNDNNNDADDMKTTKPKRNSSAFAHSINNESISAQERHRLQFGELLLLFSKVVRHEFGLEDTRYPVLKTSKKWQCAMIYGVLIGIINDKLKLNVEKYKNGMRNLDDPSATAKKRKRRAKETRKENIRKQIFIKGCRHSSRDLFKELQVNNFTNVLSIPQIQTGAHGAPRMDIETHYDMDSMDASDNPRNSFDTVSSIVAPNAPPTYRAHCVHYKEFKSSNFINYDWSSLQEVAREKLHHPRHLEMGSCLEEEELLSILLLTGTRVGLDLIESHRKYRNYCKWRVLQTNLMSALLKLKSHDRTPNSNQFFHGLLRQKRDYESQALSVNNIYLFNTFVSTTLDHRLIESSFHSKKDGALLFLDRREPVICADISWISKFPFEHEVLFAPCALTLPSPFDAHKRKKHLHTSRTHSKDESEEKKKRMSSIAEISSHHPRTKPLHKTHKKMKDPKGSALEDRTDSLAGFMLVDGRLEALSYDANDHQFLDKMRGASTDDEISKSNTNGPRLNIPSVMRNRATSDNIDGNIIASFLYGKTTANDLFLYLFQHFRIDAAAADQTTKEKYIDETVLQILFQSLFLFAIQHEYVTRNNGIKPKYLHNYMDDIYDCAQKYSNLYIGKMNEENEEYKLNTNKITQAQFIHHAQSLHQLYEQFLETIIANEMSLKYERWDESDKTKLNIPALHTGQNGSVEEMEDEYEEEEEEEYEDEYEDEEEEDAYAYEEDEYEDEYETEEEAEDEDINEIIEHVESIGAFCRNNISLLQLWMHFTDQEWQNGMKEKDKEKGRCILMNYIQFDVMVYGALAFFVMERNPDSALASRQSLNALIDQLRLSLLAAYDPDNNGYVTFNAFEYFGEYLMGEYMKLRGSLAGTPRTTQPESNDSMEYEEDDVEVEVESVSLEYDEKDVMILESLNIMQENAQNIMESLGKDLQQFNEENDDTKCNEIQQKTQQLLYLTKEMEILCNSLISDDLRYKKAKLINYIDGRREQIVYDFNQLMDMDVASD